MAVWIPVIVAVVSAAGAVAAAITASRSATRTKQAELDAGRIVELERRLSVRRAEVFQPFVEAIGEFFTLVGSGRGDDEKSVEDVLGKPLREFLNWVQIYGTDETVRASMRLMQAIYHKVPAEPLTRLLGELLLQLRRELGEADTKIETAELMAIRLTDAYTDDELHTLLVQPIDDIFWQYNWTPPWPRHRLAVAPRDSEADERPDHPS